MAGIALSLGKNAEAAGGHVPRLPVCIPVIIVSRVGMMRYSTRFSFVSPRPYFGHGSMITRSPRRHSTYLNGPIPMGLELYGSLLMSAVCSRMCFGKTHGFAPPVEKNVAMNGEYAC